MARPDPPPVPESDPTPGELGQLISELRSELTATREELRRAVARWENEGGVVNADPRNPRR